VPFTDRDPWDRLLNHAGTLVVERADGSQEKIILKKFSRPEEPAWECRAITKDILYCRIDRLDQAGSWEAWRKEWERVLPGKKRLILDFRRNRGGYLEFFEDLIPYVIEKPMCAKEFWEEGAVYVRYSQRNCELWERSLEEVMKTAPEPLRQVAEEMKEEIETKKGKGFLPEEDEEEEDEPRLPLENFERIVLLTDCFCANEAELFVRQAKKSAKVSVLGRRTSGDYHYSQDVTMDFGYGTTFTYPIAKSGECLATGKPEGIEPEEIMPWTQEDCTKDRMLERGIEIVKK
jgi:C-terminal processing protease CtpA/Prc